MTGMRRREEAFRFMGNPISGTAPLAPHQEAEGPACLLNGACRDLYRPARPNLFILTVVLLAVSRLFLSRSSVR